MYAGFVANDPKKPNNPESIEALKNKPEELTDEEKAELEANAAKWEGMAAEAQPFQGDTAAVAEGMPLGVPGVDEALAVGIILDAALPNPPEVTPPAAPSTPESQRGPATTTEAAAAELNADGNAKTSNVIQRVGGMMGIETIKKDAEAIDSNRALAEQGVDSLANRVSSGASDGTTEVDHIISTALPESAGAKVYAEEAVKGAFSGSDSTEVDIANAKKAIADASEANESVKAAAGLTTNTESAAKAQAVSDNIAQEIANAEQLLNDAETIKEAGEEAAAEEARAAAASRENESLLGSTADENAEQNKAANKQEAAAQAETTDVHNLVDLAKQQNEIRKNQAAQEMMTGLDQVA